MRNWITNKFGRNRVRTPRAQPSPAPVRPITGGTTMHTTASGIQYWFYDEMATSTMTYTGIDRSQWAGIWGTVDPIPPYPEKLRLPEGV